jgi:hypothetical protein
VPHRPCTSDEQIDRRPVERQGLHGLYDFADHVKPLPAREHERGFRRRQPAPYGVGRVLYDLLEVVERDEASAAPRYRLGQLRSCVAAAEPDAQRAGDRVVDAVER